MEVYHLTAGASGSAKMFRDDEDRHEWRERERAAVAERLLSDMLMYTHVHANVVGRDAMKAFDDALVGFVRWSNRKYGVEGQLRGPLDVRQKTDPREVARSILYDHDNPVRDGLVANAYEWPWGTAREFAGLSLAGMANVEWASGITGRARGALVSGRGFTVPKLADLERLRVPEHRAEEILRAAALTYEVRVEALVGDGRTGALPHARAVFLALARLEGYSVLRVAPMIQRSQQQASKLVRHYPPPERPLRIARTILRDPALLRMPPCRVVKVTTLPGIDHEKWA